ncbi:MAG TPA: TRAP transporter substrate-binding protein [Pseudolabrys sp.]|nr:TRAP transporter substrate-binding protein [Pseudolabrys sp.]
MRPARALPTLAFATVLSAGVASAQVQIKFGHIGAPDSLFSQSAELFAARANARLGGKAKIVIYGSSQLGGDTELLKMLKLGTVDLALLSTVMTSVAPEFGVFEMPYLVRDRAHAARIADNVVRPMLAPIAEKAGYYILGVWENGFRQITNNKHPIVKPQDLQGLKLRVPKSVWRPKMFQAYGADPKPMSLKAVFVALQTGAVDAQENSLTQIYSQKFQDVQKYLSMTGHVYTPAYVTAGANFARLPPDVQKVLADTAKEVEPDVFRLAARLDDELLDKIKQSGIKVNAVDKPAFVAASKDIYEEFSQQVPAGKGLIDKCLSLATGP